MDRVSQLSVESLEVRGYVTAFVDLLGLSTRLLGLERLRVANDDNEQRQVIRDALGPIFQMRKGFEDFLKSYVPNKTLSPEQRQQLNKEAAELLDESNRESLIVHWFSDCASVSVHVEQSDLVTVAGIFKLFGALCSVWLQMMMRRQPVRGGVAIGFGAEITPQEVIGSSLASAYALEQQAGVPRIIVSRDVTAVLDAAIAQNTTGMRQQIIAEMARMAKEFLRTDLDGRVCINPFCPAILEPLDGPDRIEAVYRVIAAIEHLHHQADDDKIRNKYAWLRQSFAELDLLNTRVKSP